MYSHSLQKTRDPVRSPIDKLDERRISTEVGDNSGIRGAVHYLFFYFFIFDFTLAFYPQFFFTVKCSGNV
ncbi:hypothetical protein F4777DRAFT_553132 [Nemania sp. FL0916]|nr:hypothetical protein F4777DRAFT_553132 [Nemania sp. FL0916]